MQTQNLEKKNSVYILQFWLFSKLWPWTTEPVLSSMGIVARGAWEWEGCSGRAGEETSGDKDVKWIITYVCLLFQWLGGDEIKPSC